MRKIGMLEFPEPIIEWERTIFHVDMDAFYAAIEQRDEPRYRNKPLVIARHPKETAGKGVVATASYEARKFGIHSAMSAKEAYQLCPHAIFVPPRHAYYQEVSKVIQQIFHSLTPLVEPLSIDEAFLDVTDNHRQATSARQLAQQLQYDIYEATQLTASVGVSYNKFLAKLASDFKKPAGLTIITPQNALTFLDQLPIDKFYGIGQQSAQKLNARGVYTGRDLRALDQETCLALLGKTGLAIYERVRGVDLRPVNPIRVRKSISKERTLYPFYYEEDDILTLLRDLANQVAKAAQNKQLQGKTIVLKIRYSDFSTLSRQAPLIKASNDAKVLYQMASELWQEVGDPTKGVRLLGMGLRDLSEGTFRQLSLLP